MSLAVCTHALAGDADSSLSVHAPLEVLVGARVSVPITVHVDAREGLPMMISAHAAGRALDVVKGRLLRVDALDPSAIPLRFELPLVATTAGVSVLTVTLLTYRCAFRCEQVRVDSTHEVRVREP